MTIHNVYDCKTFFTYHETHLFYDANISIKLIETPAKLLLLNSIFPLASKIQTLTSYFAI